MTDQTRTRQGKSKYKLSDIPSKRYLTIGEVSQLFNLEPHVLRYWEQEFPQLKPVKRRGNRRYYQRQDILIIEKIAHLLYERGFRIEGAREQLSQSSKAHQPILKGSESARRTIASLERVLSTLEKE